MDMEKVGNYILYRRRLQGWTQEDLAEAVDVSDRTIRSWEAGNVMIKTDNITKLANALGVSETEIRLGADHNEIDPETKAELDKRLRATDEITIVLEDRGIFTLDIAVLAAGIAILALALAIWAAFPDAIVKTISCTLLGFFGIVFCLMGNRMVKRMEERLEDRKDRTSVS